MFVSSDTFGFFDYFRVPYEVDWSVVEPPVRGLGALRCRDSGATLHWVRGGEPGTVGRGAVAGRYRVGDITVVGHVLATGTDGPDSPGSLVGGSGWSERLPILDAEGRRFSAVWIDERGDVLLPFDPGELMEFAWSERYVRLGRGRLTSQVRQLAIRGYYAVRPVLPRRVQLLLRRGYASTQDEQEFPAWPEEHCLQDFYEWLLDLVAEIAGRPVPYLSPWPAGRSSAFVLTHDVETAAGRDAIERLRGPERELGLRSSWNFVPERYDTSPELMEKLREEGCEIGVHGLRHDGHDLASARHLRRRLPAIRAAADAWGAVGFRSPATQRTWELMPTMGFDYDTSYTDSAPHEPQPGGCCTYLPFFNQDMVELPMTLAQDHTLFEILGHRDGSSWTSKAAAVRRRGGMVLVLAHPDYAESPGMLDAWKQLLATCQDDDTVWHALPREISAWWRRRAATTIDDSEETLRLVGPAADEAEIRFVEHTGTGVGAHARRQNG